MKNGNLPSWLKNLKPSNPQNTLLNIHLKSFLRKIFFQEVFQLLCIQFFETFIFERSLFSRQFYLPRGFNFLEPFQTFSDQKLFIFDKFLFEASLFVPRLVFCSENPPTIEGFTLRIIQIHYSEFKFTIKNSNSLFRIQIIITCVYFCELSQMKKECAFENAL